MEPYGNVFYTRLDKNRAGFSALHYLWAIEDMIRPLNSNNAINKYRSSPSVTTGFPAPRWQVAAGMDLATTTSHLVLTRVMPHPTAVTTNVYPQIALSYVAVPGKLGTISVRLAPEGGFTYNSGTGQIDDPSSGPCSPARYLTLNSDLGSNSIRSGEINGGIYVIQYEDAFSFVLESQNPLTHWAWGMAAGKLFYPLNNSDDEYLMDAAVDYSNPSMFPGTSPNVNVDRTRDRRMGDAVFVGRPSNSHPLGWLKAGGLDIPAPTDAQKGSIVRVGANTWHALAIDFTPSVENNAKILSLGLDRFVSYFVRSKSGTTEGGFLGMTKYHRTCRSVYKFRTKLVSTTMEPNTSLPADSFGRYPLRQSRQAWLVYKSSQSSTLPVELADAIDNNNVILWKRTAPGELIPPVSFKYLTPALIPGSSPPAYEPLFGSDF